MIAHPLLPKLRTLCLSGMAQTLDERVELARMRQMSHLDFLALLLDDEIDRRTQARYERMERKAGFEDRKLLAQFDFAAVPTLDRSIVLDMATCQFIQKRQNWILCGPTGVGKSHLATAIGYEAIKREMSTLSLPVARMLTGLQAARADGTHRAQLRKITGCDLLILDDFGLRPLTEIGAHDLYEIIQARYERGSIVMTSNRAPGEWADLFGNSLLASAALDRLTHHARITVITGDSYRQRQRRKENQNQETQNSSTEFQIDK